MSKFNNPQKTTQELFFRSPTALAVCDVTGIHITVGLPIIAHKVYEYSNPLAMYENSRDIGLLPYDEHKKLPIDILAGTFLSLLSHFHLIGDHLSATQRNILLQSCHPYYLSEACRMLAKASRKQALKFPAFTLEALTLEVTNSSSLDIIKNYTRYIDNIMNPKQEQREEKKVYDIFTKGKLVKHTNLENGTKLEAKKLANLLFENEQISAKFYTVIKETIKDNNLIAMDSTIRDKIIAKLLALNVAEAQKLATIYKTVEREMTIEERIMKQKATDGFEDTISSTMPSIGVKKTLKEILAEKKMQLASKQSGEERSDDAGSNVSSSVRATTPSSCTSSTTVTATIIDNNTVFTVLENGEQRLTRLTFEGKDDSNEFPIINEDDSNEF